MWKRSDDPQATPIPTASDTPTSPSPATATPTPQRTAPRPTGQPARLGPSLSCEGKLKGDEDLVVDGRFNGELHFPAHMVTIGADGRVEGEVFASAIVVEGEVRGNLAATEQILVRASGKVHGDLRAPRVALDQGCRFKGAIDMEPQTAGRPADLPLKREGRSEADRQTQGARPAAATVAT
jgi:cytoskeletal protein CcmA (bactofilin family)